jgi:hypothetical protein
VKAGFYASEHFTLPKFILFNQSGLSAAKCHVYP